MPGQQAPIEIQTDAGVKRLELLSYQDGRYTFRAAMAFRTREETTLDVGGQPIEVVTLRVGEPAVRALETSAPSGSIPSRRDCRFIRTFRKERTSSWHQSKHPIASGF
jgi:hypothetical protein